MKKMNGTGLIICGIALVCVLLVSGIVTSHVNQQRKRLEMSAYEDTIRRLEDENAALKETVDSGDITEYAAGIARDKLGYGSSNEKVYVNITGK